MQEIKYLHLKRGIYYYIRRVPKSVSHIEKRKFIRVSLRTDDIAEAATRLKKAHQETESYFASLIYGDTPEDAREKYEKAVERARYFGIEYKDAETSAQGDIVDVTNKLLMAHQHRDNPAAVDAILGGVEKPPLMLSEIPDMFFDLEKGKRINKTKDENRRWKNPRLKAIRNLIKVVGDKSISELTEDDGIAFRDFWLVRIEEEGLTGNSANKDMGYAQNMIKRVAKHKRIQFSKIFEDLRFSEDVKKQRLPFSTEFIINVLLNEKTYDGAPKAYKDLVHLMINNGARPSELVGLDDDDWHLNHEIPYIHIRPNKYRSLKTKNSERELPLVGCSLKAAQDGAIDTLRPHRGRATQLIDLLGHYFREKNIYPSTQHTLYSLRHSWEDRMIEADLKERSKAELMGHAYSRPTYGQGTKLYKRQLEMERASVEALAKR